MKQERILIVDDCQTNIDVLAELLEDRYNVASAISGEDCLEKLPNFSPDLVILDIMMPGVDGYEVCRRIKQGPTGSFTQVILVSGKASAQERLRGYEMGADDYLTKPFNHDEMLAKIRVQFKLRGALADLWAANDRIQRLNAELEQQVEAQTAEVMRARDEVVATQDMVVFSMAKLADSRDPETGEHLERMREYSQLLAGRLSREGPYKDQINQRFIENLYRSSPLHDIGKVGIPDSVLLKPGRLTPEEFEIIKTHSAIGAEALRKTAETNKYGGFLQMAVDIARHHHERFDGGGYPDGLAGLDIPLPARIVAVADVFDALSSERVYKKAIDPAQARDMIVEESGTQFDPAIVRAMLDCFEDFVEITLACGNALA